MKLVPVSTALRTALYWLLDHLKPSEQPGEQELISYEAESKRQRHTPPMLFIPAIYEPPEKTTDPTQEIHHLVETGRITALIRTDKLPRFKVHKTRLQPEVQADKWLLDAEPTAPEQPEDEDATSKSQAIVRLRHEGRGKAS